MNETDSPTAIAIEQLGSQLQKLDSGLRKDTILQAIDSLTGLAIKDSSPTSKIEVIEALGNYGGLQPGQNETQEGIFYTQREARARIVGIALTTTDADVDNAAIEALGKSLKVTDLGEGENHQAVLVDLAVVALHSGATQKQETIKKLSEYAQRKKESKGYIGNMTFPKAQKLANELIGAVGSTE